MKHFFSLFLILALAATERHVFAQEVSHTLESVLREALASNPELSAQFDRVKASRKIGTQVGTLPDPKLSYTEFVSSVETRTGPQERAVSLTQGFPWPGKLTLRESIADENARSTFFRFEAQQRQIVREVGLAFFDYAYLGEAIRISRKNYELLEQLAPTVDTKVRAGGDLSASLRLEVETTRVEDQLQGLREQRSAVSSRLPSTEEIPAESQGLRVSFHYRRQSGEEPFPMDETPSRGRTHRRGG